MTFIIDSHVLQSAKASGAATLIVEKEAFSGVKKIAQKVLKDIEHVFGVAPLLTSSINDLAHTAIIAGTVDQSSILEELAAKDSIDLTLISGKREVYLIQTVYHPLPHVEKALVIAGSDKRGTIYGLFHLSELLGVSPLVNWADVKPTVKESYTFVQNFKVVSKEPSVKYRGFFINDEWPAFGTWTNKNFGGFNVNVYELIFELLLRLKGNYLWPAMWSARFYDDGPGLANAELADELGVIMGASHHEPCLRYGEEYKYLRGKDSIYGDAWNFKTNRDGITKFWEDGLKRSGHFESVITVGMRGEADTAIMGKEATLADNIELLREVLQTQNKLIQENVNQNLTEVPRMLALYKEVEPFFYGDEQTKGLLGSTELEHTILMLCDDNHGNLRTLPTKDMLDHKGGYGMYYHFDYHGGPISYEWMNSSYLPKIWEQMTMAYDFGVRDLWVVNVGDIATQEFPLSYFLDLAYDFDKWGTAAINKTDDYTKLWIEKHFSNKCSQEQRDAIFDLTVGYTKIAHIRRPEHMNANVYHPVNYKEADTLLEHIERLLTLARQLYTSMDKEQLATYFVLVYYPVVGNLNIQKMWLLTAKNNYDAKLGLREANKLADQIKQTVIVDRELVDEYHTIANGKWYGLGLSEHIGFINWNEDGAQNPILMYTMPAHKPRLLVSIIGTEEHSEGSAWHKHVLHLQDFLQPDVCEAAISIASLSEQLAAYKISSSDAWLTCSHYEGKLDGIIKTKDVITIHIDRHAINEASAEGKLEVELPLGKVIIYVHVAQDVYSELDNRTYIQTTDYIAIEAEHFASKQAAVSRLGSFEVIKGYGKTLSAIKAFPTDAYFTAGEDAPSVEYLMALNSEGEYEVQLFMQPSNPVKQEGKLYCAIQLNNGEIQTVNTLPTAYRVDNSDWAAGVLNHIRTVKISVKATAGLNRLRVYAVSPGFVLEKLVIVKQGVNLPASYVGPKETYYVGK